MKTIVTLTCGHEKDYTGRETKLPAVGEYHPCYSSCDQVPTWRGENPNIRYVKTVDEREDTDGY